MSSVELLKMSELRQPLWLMLAFIPILSLIYRSFINKFSLPEKYFSAAMRFWYINHDKSSKRQTVYLFIVELLFWAFFAISLAGPQYPHLIKQNFNTADTDITLILLDNSSSMNADDIKPSRLGRALNEIRLLVDQLDINKSIGLILFAGKPHLLFPPTNDRDVIRYYLDMVRPDILPHAGSNLVDLLKFTNRYISNSFKQRKVSLILISDGDFSHSAMPTELAPFINQPVSVLAIGRQINTPVPALSADELWITQHGQPVLSNRNDKNLKELASKTGGEFQVLDSRETVLNKLFKKTNKATTHQASFNQSVNWIQLFPAFLIIAIICFYIRHILLLK